ncbi:MAG: Stp1/IreP family PP2C-type Ser/Thr phosphatase [Solirubrobacterales bacterium]|nr:Stp1/IreP family PP2C-type Ser/Thr phosphatase [Solirubrobacterales bacterium]
MLRVIEEAHRTDTGRQRTANEDSYFARTPVFAVADGMGGAQAGEVASRIAAKAFEPGVEPGAPAETQLREIALSANREIHELAQVDSSRAGMGTTLTAALIHGNEVSLAHVGDSRAYVLRDGELKRLTKDHSLVEELRRQGRLTEEEAEKHPQRSIITRALGPEPEVKVDTMTFPARDADTFLLCSDGLTTMVNEAEIKEILVGARSLRAAVNRLIEAANQRGGRDNITAVAFQVAEAGEVDDEGATLIARTAEQAGLTGERMRSTADRLRGRGPIPPPPRRRRIVLISLLVLALIGAGTVFVARQIYFLGTDEGGRVTLYRGLPYELPLGLNLYSEQESVGVQTESLSAERRTVVTEHRLRSHDDAEDIIRDIAEREGSRPLTPVPPNKKTGEGSGQKQGSAQQKDSAKTTGTGEAEKTGKQR